MKCLKSIAAFIIVCLSIGCTKDQIKKAPPQTEISSGDSSQAGFKESGWIPVSEWKVAHQPSHSVYYSDIRTARADANAIVLIYRRDNNTGTIKPLPYTDDTNPQQIYWYYEVNDGDIMISADVYGQAVNAFTSNSFQCIFLSQSYVQRIEKRGISKTELLTMPYEKFSQINQ